MKANITPEQLREIAMLTVIISGQTCIFDKADYEAYKDYGLRCSNPVGIHYQLKLNNYPYKDKNFARVLLAPPTGLCVDHINGNPLDNRRANLRLGTLSQNQGNRSVALFKASKLPKGVYKDRKGLRACISINGKSKHLGSFKTVEEASACYIKAAALYFGEFAKP